MPEHTEETKAAKPKVNSASQKELDKCAAQVDAFNDSVKAMTHDRLNSAPRPESEGHNLSSKQINNAPEHYLKPKRTIHAINAKTGERDQFNEKFRADWDFKKEYVQFIFYNNELTGETTTIWTKPFAGIPAEEWEVPPNRPIWGPRYLAEQIKRKFYHRLKMENQVIDMSGNTVSGAIAVDTTIQRLDAHPVSSGRKSLFMGASGF